MMTEIVATYRKRSNERCLGCGAPIIAASMMDGRTLLFDPQPQPTGGYLLLGAAQTVHPLMRRESAKDNDRYRRHRCLSLSWVDRP
jgi:hypothetical protein